MSKEEDLKELMGKFSTPKNKNKGAVKNILNVNSTTNETDLEGIQELNLDLLVEFKNHPFAVTYNDDMKKLCESIENLGVLVPITVRKFNNKYEIVSGHRRVFASKELGLKKIPALVKQLDDNQAIIEMVDSNMNREELLFSERAFAYDMQLKAMKVLRERGEQKYKNKRSIEMLAEETGENRNTIRRLIRLTELNRGLLELVDEKSIPFLTGVELSYLTKKEQKRLKSRMDKLKTIPSTSQVKKMREYDGTLSEEEIDSILTESKKKQSIKVILSHTILSEYFDEDASLEEMTDTIIELLDGWKKQKQ